MIVKGQKINDRYEIIRNVGEGGMANVYLAYDTILNRNVAVKILRGDLANDEKFVRRFQREAIAASSLTHPNIVEMYDVGVDDGNYFIVMEYIDGITLKSLIKKRGALSLTETIDIMLQITSAIACAHDSYIIHRDIKPQNVIILDDGVAKITDFGIAMALKSTELTQTNTVMGSVHYLPPEQANGKGSTVKSDIYSLGIMMYEMLIGRVPFKGENAVEIAMKQINEAIPSVCKLNPSIPQSVENIILKATAKNPKNRYDSVNEMHEDLKHALEETDSKRLTYEYPEQELEKTKELKTISSIEKEKSEEVKKEKTLNKSLVIVSIIFVVLSLTLLVTLFVLPKLNQAKDVKIPNVSGLSLAEAEKILNEAGFYVASTTDERKDDNIAEGKVIGIKNFQTGDVVKEGRSLTLIISLGTDKIVIDDYVGKPFDEVENELKRLGLQVKHEYEVTNDKEKFDENKIVKQSVEKGEILREGDIIRLTTNTLELLYPDFKTYSIDAVRNFCEENNVTLKVIYEVSNEVPGTVIAQDRAASSAVRSGTTLTITVAKAPGAALDPETSAGE